MDNKLDILTKKIYEQGVEKANHDAVEIVENARKEADKILNDAKSEAERIVNQANKESEELKTKVAADVKMAAVQSITVTKQEIEKMVVTNAAEQGVKTNLSSADFVKELVKDIVKAFNPDNASPMALDLIMPETLKKDIVPFVKNEISKMFKTEVNVNFNKKLGGGFKVAPKDGGYVIQFTDEEFTQLIANYLRPATKKILFG